MMAKVTRVGFGGHIGTILVVETSDLKPEGK